MMKNTSVAVVMTYQSSSLLQRKDIEILMQKIAKQWQLPINGHFTYQCKRNTKKIGCAAANPRLLGGKPLYYGTMGLVNGNIYLRNIRLMLY